MFKSPLKIMIRHVSWWNFCLVFICVVFLFFLPQIILVVSLSSSRYSSLDNLPLKEYGVLFGAKVDGENQLSDVAKERADAAVLLFKQEKIKKVFISGTNRANREADNLAKYLINQGIPENNITIDGLGIDTHDTCRHLQDQHITNAVLITQSFHLSRALFMCNQKDTSFIGIQVDKLGLLIDRGGNALEVTQIRVIRFLKESWLTWSYLLGIYDKHSNEAEMIEKSAPQSTSSDQYFVILGDTGAATPAQFAVSTAIQKVCDQVGGCQAGFIAGDIIYEKSVTSVTDPQFQTKFEEPYQNLNFPLYIAYGNHDYLGCTQCYLDYASHSQKWRMPAAYYVQNFGAAVSFFVIDTEKFGAEQQTWLKENLAASQAHHKIVIGHRPIETFETTKLGENWNGKAELQIILCQTVDAYVAGHAHVLEDNGQIGDCSVKQLVSGGGGAYTRTISPKSDGDFSAAKNGFVLLQVTEQELSYTFLDSRGEVLFRSQTVAP